MRQTSKPNAEAGYTLLEVLVVVAILGVMAAVLAGFGRPAAQGPRDTLREIVATLRLARVEAVHKSQSQAVVFDMERRRYGLSTPDQDLPEGTEARLTSLREARVDGHQAIQFFPDGSSTGGILEITQHGQIDRLEVRWITGQVRHVD